MKEMIAKSPASDNILLIWMCQIRIIESGCCLSQDIWIWDWIISMAATSYADSPPQRLFFTRIVKADLPHPVSIDLF